MKFSQFAGTSIVPTLSRLVLAAAFVTAGYNKLMRDAVFNAGDAETLRTLGVTVVKVTTEPGGDATAARTASERQIVLATFQEVPEETEDVPAVLDAIGDAVEDAAEELDGALEQVQEAAGEHADGETADEMEGEPAAPGGAETPAVTPLPDDGSRYTAKRVHGITLMCYHNQWPAPKALGYAAGITELLGGGLMLIGFLTRLFALGLAGTMGVAFYLVSIGFYGVHQMSPFDFALDTDKFHAVISQLALFVLAFGLFMTGAGPLSLDRLLFGRGGSKKKGSVEIEYEDVDSSPTRAL